MKQIVLSFDDGRWDTYERALPIIEKYGLKCTINIISDFVHHSEKYHLSCCEKGSMTANQVVSAQKKGMEIGCHGQKHNNDIDGILSCINNLADMGVDVSDIGFASPRSFLTSANCEKVNELKHMGYLSYIRSGVQLRREGYFYAGLTVINRYLHCKFLFNALNKRWIIEKKTSYDLLPSISVTSDILPEQIEYFISHLKDGQSIILLFHSILAKNDPGYGDGLWYWDSERFQSLCKYLSNTSECNVISTSELVRLHES